MALNLDQKVVISSRCAWQAVAGEAVVIDLDQRRVMGLNPSASWVWTHLSGASVEELGHSVAKKFEVALDVALEDVRTFLSAMLARGLVEKG